MIHQRGHHDADLILSTELKAFPEENLPSAGQGRAAWSATPWPPAVGPCALGQGTWAQTSHSPAGRAGSLLNP